MSWLILNALADDREPFCLVWRAVTEEMPNTSPAEVAACLAGLVAQGLVTLPPGVACDPAKMLDDLGAEYDTDYWLALTQAGSAAWQLNAEKCGGPPVSWDEAWVCDLNYESGAGSIQGTTEAVCVKELGGLSFSLWNDGYRLDQASFRHSAITGFFAKYHKYLSGGHRIDFNFSRQEEV